jgi:hypothetical protein
METYTMVPQQVFVEFFGKLSYAASPVEARVNDADAARSEENILQWMSYLPEDCIRTMINLGWDVST